MIFILSETKKFTTNKHRHNMFNFIRIRKAKNGFIFKKRNKFVEGEILSHDNEDDYEYELVQESELNQKFGEAFNPSSISQEDGEVVICMHFCNAKIYDKKKRDIPDTIMKIKQMFAMYQHEMFAPKEIVIIEFTDKDNLCLECYDEDAERVNRQTNLPIMEKDKVRYLWLSANQENKRLLGTLNPHVIKTTSTELMKWYEGTKVEQQTT